jgi:hypothetical protein
MTCSQLSVSRRFRAPRPLSAELAASPFLGLFYNPENGSKIIIRNGLHREDGTLYSSLAIQLGDEFPAFEEV